jgi:transposase
MEKTITVIVEEEMIQVEQREQIRRAYFIEHKSMRQIARELGHSRETVRKMIDSEGPSQYTLTQPRTAPVLGPYKARIEALVAENERLPRKQRYTGHKIFEIVEGEGYQGAESTVRGYVAQCRRAKKRPKLYIPLEFEPGTDAQMDWGEAVVIMAGQEVKVQMFLLRLCYSRRLFVMAFPSQSQEAFFEGHVQAFHFFGGVPGRISYDNLKTAVKRVLTGRNRQEQETFILFRSHYLFESHFCTPGEAHEKGRVEDGVGFARRNYLVPIPEVASFAELNDHLLAQCLADDERRIKRQPQTIGEAWAVEKPQLLPLPAKDFDCGKSRVVTRNGFSQVEFDSNRYSVPTDEQYRQLVLKVYAFRIKVLHLDDVIADHPRCYEREQDILDPLHYLPLLEQKPGAFNHAKPIRRWRESWPPIYDRLLAQLRARWPEGRGVREFIRILKLHRSHPAELVAQAVEQALTYQCAHADGVKVCLAQLLQPEQALDPLDLTNWPRLQAIEARHPNLQRYDQLLGGER